MSVVAAGRNSSIRRRMQLRNACSMPSLHPGIGHTVRSQLPGASGALPFAALIGVSRHPTEILKVYLILAR